MMSLSGDEIVMTPIGSLGPIDPQMAGVPVAAILGGFREAQERLASGDVKALRAYGPLLQKLDLHVLEMCRMADELARDLAVTWLSKYMLRCDRDDPRVEAIVKFFADAEIHKTHSRSVDRQRAREVGLKVKYVEEAGESLPELIQSLYNQYEMAFDKTGFSKFFENTYGVNWGRMHIVTPALHPQLQ